MCVCVCVCLILAGNVHTLTHTHPVWCIELLWVLGLTWRLASISSLSLWCPSTQYPLFVSVRRGVVRCVSVIFSVSVCDSRGGMRAVRKRRRRKSWQQLHSEGVRLPKKRLFPTLISHFEDPCVATCVKPISSNWPRLRIVRWLPSLFEVAHFLRTEEEKETLPRHILSEVTSPVATRGWIPALWTSPCFSQFNFPF